MGEVWKARDTRLDRVVALKRLNPEHSKRFVQEAKTIAALNHPHVCQLYDVGPDYLVMEYIEGKTLRKMISGQPLPISQMIEYAIQVADGLSLAHDKAARSEALGCRRESRRRLSDADEPGDSHRFGVAPVAAHPTRWGPAAS